MNFGFLNSEQEKKIGCVADPFDNMYLLNKSIIYKKMCHLLWELKTCNLLFVHFTPGKSCHEGAENFC